MKYLCYCLIALNILSGCSRKIKSDMPGAPSPSKKSYSYLALGDSYTIGESVSQPESFPYQLASLLTKESIAVKDIKIIARTGWTTDELKSALSDAKLPGKYDFVTLLIGVNNQYRHYGAETYRKEFVELLYSAISFAGNDKSKVFVISIPDWGATPFAKGQDRDKIALEIDHFNAINKEETDKAGVPYIDITPQSRKAINDMSLVASDGLHPSAKMYSFWANQLLPKIIQRLKQ